MVCTFLLWFSLLLAHNGGVWWDTNELQWGKVLFMGADLIAGKLIERILKLRGGLSKQDISFWTCTWLFHPFVINISTRGNADSLVCVLILLVILALLEKRYLLAAVYYGLAVHMRIFPIFFAPSFVLFLNDDYFGNVPGQRRPWYLQAFKERFLFGFVSGSVFLALGAAMYLIYGWAFLHETYLYHLVRTDNRHNFSVYFYTLYLQYGKPIGFITGLSAFLPQIFLQASASASLHQDIVLCTCLQTMAFVAFNKVCTAQYFEWFVALLPIVVPSLKNPIGWHKGLFLIGSWFASELLWLYFGYHLEMQGENVFLQLWTAGLVFFACNVHVIYQLVMHARPITPTFDTAGKLTSLATSKSL